MFHGHEESLLIDLKRGENYKVTGAYIDRFCPSSVGANANGAGRRPTVVYD
jgi:hypothetical protein